MNKPLLFFFLKHLLTMTFELYPVIFSQINCLPTFLGLPGGASDKEPTCQCRRQKKLRFCSWVGRIPWRRAWQPTRVFLPRESHGLRSLVGYSPGGCKELDTTEQLHFHFHFPNGRSWLGENWVLP